MVRLVPLPPRPVPAAAELRQLRRLLRPAQGKAVFQAGTLYLDGRAATCASASTTRPSTPALAGLSRTYLAYCDCTRGPAGRHEDRRAVSPTATPDFLWWGGTASSTTARAATGTPRSPRSSRTPISLRQAFWSPYKRFVRAERAGGQAGRRQGQGERGPALPGRRQDHGCRRRGEAGQAGTRRRGQDGGHHRRPGRWRRRRRHHLRRRRLGLRGAPALVGQDPGDGRHGARHLRPGGGHRLAEAPAADARAGAGRERLGGERPGGRQHAARHDAHRFGGRSCRPGRAVRSRIHTWTRRRGAGVPSPGSSSFSHWAPSRWRGGSTSGHSRSSPRGARFTPGRRAR